MASAKTGHCSAISLRLRSEPPVLLAFAFSFHLLFSAADVAKRVNRPRIVPSLPPKPSQTRRGSKHETPPVDLLNPVLSLQEPGAVLYRWGQLRDKHSARHQIVEFPLRRCFSQAVALHVFI